MKCIIILIIIYIYHKLTKLSYNIDDPIIYDLISIQPECDGEGCIFSIHPNLPDRIKLNENTGEISGKIVCDTETKEYTVKCKNIWKCKLMIGFKSTIFIEQYKNVNVSITNANNYYSHCWINLVMESGVYKIRLKFHQNNYSPCNDEMYIN